MLVILVSCASVEPREPTPAGVQIDGVRFINRLPLVIHDVQILAQSTGDFVSCGTIMARSECSTGFPNRAYNQGKLVVTWVEQGQPQTTGEFVLNDDEQLDMQKPAWIEVNFYSRGQAGIRLVQ